MDILVSATFIQFFVAFNIRFPLSRFTIVRLVHDLHLPTRRLTVLEYSPDRQHTAHAPFLSHEELQLMRQRVELDRKDYVPDHLDRVRFFSYLSDVTLWLYALLAMFANMYVFFLIASVY